MRKVTVVSIVFWAHLASSQVESGTIVIFNASQDKLVIAADSRIVSGIPFAPPRDTACKIRAFSNQVIFASAGLGGIAQHGPGPDIGWTNEGIADIVIPEFLRHGPSNAINRAQVMATIWGEKLSAKVNNFYTWHPDVIKEDAKIANPLTEAIFANVHHHAVEWDTVGIYFDGPTKSPPVTYDFIGVNDCWSCGQTGARLCAIGSVSTTREFCAQKPTKNRLAFTYTVHAKKRTARKLDTQELITIKVAEFTAMHDTTGAVGGPIDAIEVRKDGTVRWLQRKEECKENDD